MVARNMARVAGAQGPGAGESLVKGAYLSYARYWLETFRLGRYSRQELLDMVDGVNVEIIDKAVAARSGLLAVLPHFGFYDLVGAWAGARDYPLTTVAEVLKQLEATHPGFAARLYDEKGQLRRFVNVFVADEDIRFLQGLDTPVAEGQVVSIVPAVAGG